MRSSLLSKKKILLGISAGIAAYKTPSLVRLLVQYGCEVKVILTPTAKDFVTPLTLSVVSKNPVLSEFTSEESGNPLWNNHVACATWADAMVVAPATSNTLSSMVHAKCNNLLLATYLSVKCPVFVAPAMDLEMYAHPANQRNLEFLEAVGNIVLPVGDGFLASGLKGKGRMLEPEEIVEHIITYFTPNLPLKGKTVLITAGPTYESIDPVRFIGNKSSGKMGFALAKQAASLGAKVILITGPTHLEIENPLVERISVTSTDEMFEAVKKHYDGASIAIAAAAVSDFKPTQRISQKIKKESPLESLLLSPTVDILKYMGEQKKNQFLVGFALETNNEENNAVRKLKSKNLNAIVLNSLQDKGAGFLSDQNKITYFRSEKNKINFDLKPKLQVAQDIFDEILKDYD